MMFLHAMRRLATVCLLLGCAAPRNTIPAPPRLRLEADAPVLMGPVACEAAPDGTAWAPLANGGRVTVSPEGASLVASNGTVSARRPLRDPSRCTALAWRDRGVVFCADEGDAPETLAGAPPRLLVLRGDAREWVASRDGETLTREGACFAEAPVEGVLSACSFEDGAWREWRTDARGALLDRYGSLALVTRCGEVACDVALFDIDLARWHQALLPDAAGRWVRAGFDSDGSLVGVMHTGSREALGWFVTGRPDGAMRALRLPAAVDEAATDGRDRALFLRGGESWFTDDGGLSLRPLTGVPSASPGGAPLRPGRGVVCEGATCVIAHRCAVRARPRGQSVP